MLNPQLYSPTAQPLRVRGEQFLTVREGIQCAVRVAGLPELHASGKLLLTHLRIVFVASRAVPLGGGQAFHSFEFPLSLLSNEKFNQPIFGANNLTGTVQPLSGSGLPGPADFRLTFKEGGCGTFLHFFLRALRDVRTSRTDLASAASAGLLHAQSVAMVDPSDPSVIYLSQPADVPLSSVAPSAYGRAAVVVPEPERVPDAVAVVQAVPVATVVAAAPPAAPPSRVTEL